MSSVMSANSFTFGEKMSTKNLEFSLCIRILFSQKWRDVSIILFFVDFSPSFFYQDFPLYSMNQHMIQSRFYLLWEKSQTDAKLSDGIGILLGFIGQKLKIALISSPNKNVLKYQHTLFSQCLIWLFPTRKRAFDSKVWFFCSHRLLQRPKRAENSENIQFSRSLNLLSSETTGLIFFSRTSEKKFEAAQEQWKRKLQFLI